MRKSRLLKHNFIIVLIIILILFIVPIYSNAVTSTINPGDWEPNALTGSDTDAVFSSAKIIVSAIRYIGIIVSVVALLILGIKYMTGSVEEKADYKKGMKAYLLGVLLTFALSQVLAVVIDVASGLES